MIVHKRLRVRPGEEGRADRIVQGLTQLSRADVRGLFDNQCVKINGRNTRQAGHIVKAGDTIELEYDKDRRYHEKPTPRSRSFKLVYEDDHLLVVDKQAGILTVPTSKHETNTLTHELARYVNKGPHIRKRVAIVHRLDRDTSGLLVFGKSEAVANRLKQQFAQRKPEREYVAIVAGRLAQDEGTITSHLATAPDLDQYSTTNTEKGKLAVTHYTVQKRLPDATVIRVRLETGRRNQIRVHFAEKGHPVLGDDRYQRELAKHRDWDKSRLALHATVLGFTHPVTGEKLRFVSPPPSAFGRFGKASKPRN